MTQHRITSIEIVAHAVIIAAPFVLLVVLALQQLAPSGVRTVSAGTLDRSPYINRILPLDRAPADASGDFVSLVDEPAYFTVHVPDGFTAVDVTVEFNQRHQPIVELGALTDIFAQSYDLQPLANTILDALDWPTVTEGDRTLYQREATYASIDEFVANPPARASIATYHDELETPYRETSYTPLGATQTLTASLRGYHKFATYVKNETFSFTFGYMDMNRTEGPDDGVIRVWNEAGEVVLEQHLRDDGITSDGQDHVGMQRVTLTGAGWAEGVYEVELSGTSDIFWRTITTSQRYVTFLNRLYVGDDVGYRDGDHRTNFVTNAKHFTFETFHADSSEEIVLGNIAVQLPESHQKVRYDVDAAGLVEGFTAKGDVKMTSDGLLALSAQSFFNPYPVQLNVYSDLDALGVDYVLTTFTPPEPLDDGWRSATVSVDLAKVFLDDGSISFVLSAPDIEERGGRVDIRRVTTTYRKDPPTLRDMARQLRDWFLR